LCTFAHFGQTAIMTGLRPHLHARPSIRLAGLLLVLLALRALVPAGFMATASATGVEMVFCEPGAAGSMHHGPAHHHRHAGAGDPSCPFAQSAGPAPLPAIPVLAAETPLPALVSVEPYARAIATQGPPRQQTPRGPPNLA
jgi:hypothetical protein